jgi:hypothetical protein
MIQQSVEGASRAFVEGIDVLAWVCLTQMRDASGNQKLV